MATFIPTKELLSLYGAGWFPMACEDGELRLFSPDPRGVLPLDCFRVPHGAKADLEKPDWQIRCDTAFREVLDACANRKETWIDERIVESYMALHEAGQAHSIEVWKDGHLAGGLYGVRLGAAFFGESMFHKVTGASKVALAELVNLLRIGGFQLLDIQWITPHLRLFGAIEISRTEYLKKLRQALKTEAHWPTSPVRKIG